MATEILGGDLKVISDLSIPSVSPILLQTRAFSKAVEVRESVSLNDTVQVFVGGAVPDATEYDDDDNNYETDNGGSHAWKPVTITNHVKSGFSLPIAKIERLDVKGVASIYSAHAKKVALQTSALMFAKIVASSFGMELVLGDPASFDASDVNAAETALATATGLGTERYMILKTDYFKSLRDDTSIASSQFTGSSDVVRNGVIPGIYGFNEIIRTNVLPTAEHMVGLVTDATGLLFAQAIEDPRNKIEDVEFELAVDPDTGITLGFSGHYSSKTRKFHGNVESWIGCGIGRPEGLIRLVSAANT